VLVQRHGPPQQLPATAEEMSGWDLLGGAP
jgi:hypothetical protein